MPHCWLPRLQELLPEHCPRQVLRRQPWSIFFLQRGVRLRGRLKQTRLAAEALPFALANKKV
jgi:hypothetical protein